MAEPTYRMSMLPFGTYANPDGTESLGLAVPGMIQEPVNALMRLFGSGNFAQGPDYPGNADDMRTLLFSMYGGNAMNPAATLPQNAVGMFAGRMAKTADHAALARAEELAGQGVPRDQIWNETGWFQGPDRSWLYETNDSGLMAPHGARTGLTDIHPELAAAYPELSADLPINIGGSGLTYFSSGDQFPRGINVSAGPGERAALAHELQHFVQHAEGRLEPTPKGAKPWEMYNSFPEVEARNVQFRSNMTSEERAALPPWVSSTTGKTLFSDTGKPSLMGSAIAGAETPQRMYHDTGKPSLFGSAIAGARDNLQARYRDWRYPDEAVARSYNQIAKDKPTETLGDFDLRRSATSNRGGMKYDLFNGSDPIASLMIDAPRRLSPTPFDMATASSFEKLERAQPLAGTITRIEVNEGHRGKGIASSLLDVAENDLKSAGAILHPGDTSMTQDFMNLYAKRDPEMMRDAFARMGVGNFDDQALMFNRALRSRASRKSDTPNLTLYSDNLPSIWGNALAPYQDEPRNALLNY